MQPPVGIDDIGYQLGYIAMGLHVMDDFFYDTLVEIDIGIYHQVIIGVHVYGPSYSNIVPGAIPQIFVVEDIFYLAPLRAELLQFVARRVVAYIYGGNAVFPHRVYAPR